MKRDICTSWMSDRVIVSAAFTIYTALIIFSSIHTTQIKCGRSAVGEFSPWCYSDKNQVSNAVGFFGWCEIANRTEAISSAERLNDITAVHVPIDFCLHLGIPPGWSTYYTALAWTVSLFAYDYIGTEKQQIFGRGISPEISMTQETSSHAGLNTSAAECLQQTSTQCVWQYRCWNRNFYTVYSRKLTVN